jgi:3-oxoacyl-[acyl-carrier-protein] synthase III
MRTIPFSIAGSAVTLPARAVASVEVDARIGMAPGYIESAFGIRRRRWAGADETSSAMAASAASQALEAAGWLPDSLDVIVGACGVMEQPIPGTAPLVQGRLGLGASGIPAFDVNASCRSCWPSTTCWPASRWAAGSARWCSRRTSPRQR